ncbi:hypothetical protein BIV57_13410 [Mangrovactinospora gilvigrisea]|uniref:Uncharacterized protein n=1 Tax=Mangrovactinospora gilvigrisea TaxID=1428644 RepID=A0A1J7C620_9ACTN|nr:hypothetical protein BIV57_13410 [Mangrovactinospora gilvigrisea]
MIFASSEAEGEGLGDADALGVLESFDETFAPLLLQPVRPTATHRAPTAATTRMFVVRLVDVTGPPRGWVQVGLAGRLVGKPVPWA